MNIDEILSEIDAEISRLVQVKAILGSTTSSVPAKRKPGRPPSALTALRASAPVKTARRTMSPEGRAKIAAAQKARWAKTKRAAAPVAKRKPGRPAKKAAPAAKKAETTSSTAA